jgi:hypothetical protein
MGTVQLSTVGAGLVQDFRSVRPSINKVIDLLQRQRSRLGESHSSHGWGLNIAGGYWVLGDIFADLSTTVCKLTDAKRSVSFGGCDDGLECFNGVP